MKKNTIVLSLIFALISASALAWPFGNIGINVDHAVSQLDVGGDAVIRKSLVLPCDLDCISEEDVAYEIQNRDSIGNPGFYIWSCSAAEWQGFYIEDDELTAKGLKRIDSDWIQLIGRQDPYNVVPDEIIHFDNCSSINVTNTINKNNLRNSESVCVLTDSNDNFAGTTIKLDADKINYPVALKIFGNMYNADATTLRVVVGYGNDPTEWFTLNVTDDFCVELYYVPRFRGWNVKGRWHFIKAFQTYDLANLEPSFSYDDGGRINSDGSGLDE